MRLYRKRKKILLLLILIAIIALVIFWINTRVRPMIIEFAVVETSDVVTITVNKTITDKLADGSINYNDLVTLEKDEDGHITALITNMAKTNTLRAEIVNEIITKLSDKGQTNIAIPLGNFFGNTLLSGRGPNINVNIISVTNVDTYFSNEFSSTGINQTRHQIMLNIDVGLTILIPGYSSTVDVPVEMCVAETVIVGEVPNSYANW